MKRIGLLLILAVVCGCNGGAAKSGDTGKTDALVTPAAAINSDPMAPVASDMADKRPAIVCFGDSITAGLGVDPDKNYPADMQRDLDAKGYRYRVVNMGVSGETTKDGLARVERVLALKPAVVVVEFGGNDGLRGLRIGDTQAALDEIVATLKKSGTTVALAGISLPPSYGADYVSRFNAIFPAVAKKNGVAVLPLIYKDVYGVPGFIQDDGVHPTAAGDVQVAKNVEGLILGMLKK